MDSVRASKLTSLRWHKTRRAEGRDFCSCKGKADRKDSAATRAIAARNVTAVLANNTVRSAQAKAGTFTYGLSGVKRIEDVFRFKQSASTVGEFDLNLLVHHAQSDQ